MATHKKQRLVELGVSGALILVTVAYFWSWAPRTRNQGSAREIEVPAAPLSIADAHPKGSEKATVAVVAVAVVAFSDFQCPFCARFATTTLKDIEAKYVSTGKVLLAYRHTPLTAIHPVAVRAAEAAECAGEQGRFWEMHDLLYANNKQLAPKLLGTLASSLNIDTGKYRACMDGDTRRKVRGDMALSDQLSIRSTPVFMVGRLESGRVRVQRVISGAVDAETFEAALEAVLGSTRTVAAIR
jgi:protein-disulfide isomerase